MKKFVPIVYVCIAILLLIGIPAYFHAQDIKFAKQTLREIAALQHQRGASNYTTNWDDLNLPENIAQAIQQPGFRFALKDATDSTFTIVATYREYRLIISQNDSIEVYSY